MCQIGPANGRAILIHRRQIRLLLRARARQIRVMLVDPVTNRTRGIRGRHELDAQLLGQRLIIDRISSSNRPGTFHVNWSGVIRESAFNGTCTVTPSAGSAGSYT